MFCGAPDVYVYFECDAVCYSVSLRDEPPKKDKSKKKARRCVGRALNCFVVLVCFYSRRTREITVCQFGGIFGQLLCYYYVLLSSFDTLSFLI